MNIKKKNIGIKISLLSSEQVLNLSCGEVLNDKTLNYKNFKPEKGGLFCSRIFGSSEKMCFCGKQICEDLNFICNKCGVEIFNFNFNSKRVRYGHVELSNYFINSLYYKTQPNYLSLLLNISTINLKKILYNNYYVVLFSNIKKLKKNCIISIEKYIYYKKKYYNKFWAETGIESLYYLLNNLNLIGELKVLKKKIENNINNLEKLKKRYNIIKYIQNFKLNPIHIFFKRVIVLPSDLRPIIKLPNENIVCSDLNELYKRIINSNLRLKILNNFFGLPKSIIFSEKNVLQNHIDNLFLGKNKNENNLKSLSENISGKKGFFRKNLLGKRVDYSGRAVIVSGPNLKFGECGVPINLAAEILRPFIYNKILIDRNSNIKSAKYEVDILSSKVLSITTNIIKNFNVLINRAPTLHKLSTQGFKPVLTCDKTIKLHPLVCQSFNADFDGDQMSIHLPISFKSNLEFKKTLNSKNNILYPSSGISCISPNKDMILGIYYYTRFDKFFKNMIIFNDINSILSAYKNMLIDYNSIIFLRFKIFKNNKLNFKIYKTNLSRILIFKNFPLNFCYSNFNKTLNNKMILKFINFLSGIYKNECVANISNNLMKLGFNFCSFSGFSMSLNDIIINFKKFKLLNKTISNVIKYNVDHLNFYLTRTSKKKKITDIWELCFDLIFNIILKNLNFSNFMDSNGLFIKSNSFKNFYIMLDSGARGSDNQIKQISCNRGFIGYKKYDLMDTPVLSSLKEGLNVLEYFYFSHNSRKTLADTALKTSKAGYLTRKLVESSNNIYISEIDCFTNNSIIFETLIYDGEVLENFYSRIFGRVLINDFTFKNIIIKKNTILNNNLIMILKKMKINSIKLRSPLTCQAKHGICSFCYGLDLSKNKIVDVGEMVGIIAAQSIGEPGTQLTMRTFHSAGALKKQIKNSFYKSNFSGYVEYSDNIKFILNKNNLKIVVSNFSRIFIKNRNGDLLEEFKIPKNSYLFVENNSYIEENEIICKWDSDYELIISSLSGYIYYKNFIENINFINRIDLNCLEIICDKNSPKLIILDSNKKKEIFNLPLKSNDLLMFNEESFIDLGDIIIKKPIKIKLTEDIVEGLPKIDSLFEARIPQNISKISPVKGLVKITNFKKKIFLNIVNLKNFKSLYSLIINNNNDIIVSDGDFINIGDPITQGNRNPHDILNVYGKNYLINFYLKEIQNTYQNQGVFINDKHLEIIISQMLSFVIISKSGKSFYTVGEIVSLKNILYENSFLNSPFKIHYKTILMGVTNLSLKNKSFLSAASFQRTKNVLNESAIKSNYDDMLSLKTKIMQGKIFEAGPKIYNKILNIY